MLGEGTFPCKVVRASNVLSSKKGTPGVAVTVAIEGDQGETIEMVGTIWITDASAGMARMQLKSFGFEVDKQDLAEIDAGAIDGAVSTCTLRIEEYQNQSRLKIASFGRQPRPSEEQLSTALSALRSAKKREQGMSMPPTGGDIPF